MMDIMDTSDACETISGVTNTTDMIVNDVRSKSCVRMFDFLLIRSENNDATISRWRRQYVAAIDDTSHASTISQPTCKYKADMYYRCSRQY